jgi:hypothetical protein
MIAYVVPNITMAGYGRIKDISPSIEINKNHAVIVLFGFVMGFFNATFNNISACCY